MIAFKKNTAFSLSDAAHRDLGQVCDVNRSGNRVFGTFIPGADYGSVETQFQHLEEVIEGQILSLLDSAQAEIANLGIRQANGSPLQDVQIFSDGGISFREVPDVGRNGSGAVE